MYKNELTACFKNMDTETETKFVACIFSLDYYSIYFTLSGAGAGHTTTSNLHRCFVGITPQPPWPNLITDDGLE